MAPSRLRSDGGFGERRGFCAVPRSKQLLGSSYANKLSEGTVLPLLCPAMSPACRKYCQSFGEVKAEHPKEALLGPEQREAAVEVSESLRQLFLCHGMEVKRSLLFPLLFL